ncbi:hypothetical protein [Streptomyces massasporeus]|uniref:hypothetical protein n=1 Tax=Streptomyces massasporeus TaxID=67324 RepID=UPI0033D67F9C
MLIGAVKLIIFHSEAEVGCDLDIHLPVRADTAVQSVPDHPLKHLSGKLGTIPLNT